jgi:hypothetical protein
MGMCKLRQRREFKSETGRKTTHPLLQTLAACEILAVSLLVASASAKPRPDHPYRYSAVDMPVTLAVGTVRTPEFSAASQWYWIMVQVEKPLPFREMECMMGVSSESSYCSTDDPLLQATWTVWDGENKVYAGGTPDRCACMFENKHIYKFLGDFPAQGGKKYVVEVKFTKDGRPLNVANPHLIVTRVGYE